MLSETLYLLISLAIVFMIFIYIVYNKTDITVEIEKLKNKLKKM